MKHLNSNLKVNLFQSSIFLLASILIIILRYPSFILKPRMWAEESIYFETFFSSPNIMDGFDALIYPAYYVLISRVVGLLASLVNPENAALITTICGLVIFLIPLIIIFFGNSNYWASPYQKIVLSAFLIFSCSTGEIWMNSTNVGFIMAVATFLILIDESPGSNLKKFLYGVCLFLAILTGPISLLMSPFFLYRFIQKKESNYLIYCILFLVLGLFQISYFLTSYNLEDSIGNLNRGIFISNSIIESFYYWITPNIIFPILGYFFASGFRSIIILANQNPEQLISISESIPFNTGILIEWLIIVLPILTLITCVAISALYLFLIKNSGHDEKVYMLILFLYLSLILTSLSLGGHGGYRYSYVCSFILMFYIFQQFLTLQPGIVRSLTKALISLSLIIGILEYYPRVISFSPDFRSAQESPWPNWKEEVITWKNESTHRPRVWPHLRMDTGIWPERSTVWSINLNNPETWKNSGNYKYSIELKKALQRTDK